MSLGWPLISKIGVDTAEKRYPEIYTSVVLRVCSVPVLCRAKRGHLAGEVRRYRSVEQHERAPRRGVKREASSRPVVRVIEGKVQLVDIRHVVRGLVLCHGVDERVASKASCRAGCSSFR